MTTSDADLRSRVLLSVQRALVGEITPQMRYIEVEISGDRIHIIVWYDGILDEILSGNGGSFDGGAITQVAADFAWPERGDPDVSFEFVRCDLPIRPDFRGILVYGRSETNVISKQTMEARQDAKLQSAMEYLHKGGEGISASDVFAKLDAKYL